MADHMLERRRQVAALVRDLYDNRITSTEFFQQVGAIDVGDDPEVRALIDAIAREPADSWFFGVAGETHRRHAERIRKFVEAFGP